MNGDPYNNTPPAPCKCGKSGESPHICPYQAEINDDNTPCNCCNECASECADEI